MARIVFLCLHNACRSRIAETIARDAAPPSWTIESAGLLPTVSFDLKAAEILRLNGLAMTPRPPQGLSQLPALVWDYAVSVGCGDPHDSIRAHRYAEWIVPDPYDATMNVYAELYLEILGRVTRLIRRLKEAP